MKTMDVPVTLLWPIRKSMAARGLDREAFCAYDSVDHGLLAHAVARNRNGRTRTDRAIGGRQQVWDLFYGVNG
ncbi:hypothetical protein [Paenibacillus sp. FSL W8-0194]|uniref:hypothetical protein n=1 Tax=Paenibacillus sp. FSL W8-0194 TaxID=2921711 RepID=UPI0030DC0F63